MVDIVPTESLTLFGPAGPRRTRRVAVQPSLVSAGTDSGAGPHGAQIKLALRQEGMCGMPALLDST